MQANYAALAEALVEQGAVAHAVNAAAGAVIEACNRWQELSDRQTALASSVGRLRPGDWSMSRASAAERECQRLLGRGGEQPPVVRDPTTPRHATVIAEDASEAVPYGAEAPADFTADPVPAR